MRVIALAVALPLLAMSAAVAQQSRVAEIFPPGTLIYLEIRQPAEMAKQLAAFAKGTPLENALPSINRVRDKRGPGAFGDISAFGVLASMVGPEMLKEASRFQGMAAGLTGFGKQGEPAYLAVLLSGDSQLPGLMMRAYLSVDPSVRKIAAVEGIDLYRESTAVYPDPIGGADAPVAITRTLGPVFAFQPGIVLLGSDQETVAAAIRRHKGNEKGKSLASNAAVKAEAARDARGLFLFADTKALLQRQSATGDHKGPHSPVINIIRKLLPAAGIESLTAHLELNEQEIAFHGTLQLDASVAQPLADLFSGPPLAVESLNGIVRDASAAVTLNFPAGEQRLPRLLSLLDTAVKATGTLGPSGSELLRELEEKKTLTSAALAQIDRLTLELPPTSAWPKGETPLPTLLIESGSPEALALIAGALPTILELLGGQKADAVTETIEGVKVRSLEAKASPLGAPIHYGQRGNSLAIGPDRQGVAACLAAGPQRGLASRPEVADALTATRPSMIGVCNWADLLRPRASVKSRPPQVFAPPAEPERADSAALGSILSREVLASLKDMPPLVLTLGREKNELRFALRQRDPQCLRAKAMERLIGAMAESQRTGRMNEPDVDGPFPKFPPELK